MADSIEPEDIEVVNYMKQEVQNLEDEQELARARKSFVKMQIEGEKPTQYFCKMNRKIRAKAQFEEILLEDFDKNGKEVTKVIKDQDEIEKEVRKFYSNLFKEGRTCVDKETIIRNIETMTKVDEESIERLDNEITEEEVSCTLKNTKNNVAPGPGGFGGAFYKVFWKYLKQIVVGAIKEVYEN